MIGPSGLLVIDKPGGITSHGAVSAVRRALDTRKVGHAGTLDPMATGVLLIGVGRATRLLGHLALHGKSYAATIRLGASTVTDDREGEVLERAAPERLAVIDDTAIRSAAARFLGPIEQVPSSVSAIKVEGQRAHALVRAGADVELAPRQVVVDRFAITGISRPDQGWIDVDVEIDCSTGTYVRALARDLGRDLVVGGHLTALRRTRVGDWGLGEAIDLAAASPERLVGIDEVAARSFPVAPLEAARVDDIRHGRVIGWPMGDEPVIALTDDSGRLVALAERRGERARTLVVFAE